VRAKISEVLLAVSACRTSITEVYQSGGTPPGAGNWGCESGVASKYVQQISTSTNGVVTATVTGISASVNGGVVSLAPLIANATTVATVANNMGQGLFGWRCGSSIDGTTLSSKYLPGSCRGA
jgi:type IV pilus assembly protein PilA